MVCVLVQIHRLQLADVSGLRLIVRSRRSAHHPIVFTNFFAGIFNRRFHVVAITVDRVTARHRVGSHQHSAAAAFEHRIETYRRRLSIDLRHQALIKAVDRRIGGKLASRIDYQPVVNSDVRRIIAN